MPYKSMKDVNKAIKGIKPKVTLAQANKIAEMADAIEKKGEAESPWAVAIAQFKEMYKKKGGKWVKKKKLQEAVSEESYEEIRADINAAVRDQYGSNAWILETYEDHVIVEIDHEKYLKIPYTLSEDGEVGLGSPTPVTLEKEYVELKAAERDAREKEPKSYRLTEAISLEGVEPQDAEGKEWIVTLIEAGWTEPSGIPPIPKHYGEEILREALPLFDNLPLFKNHATNAELRERPERRIEEKAGWFEGRFMESGKVKAHMFVVDPWLRAVLLEAHAMGKPDFIQLSIDADGLVAPYQEGDQRGLNVEALTKMYSVDAVTTGSAGGALERLVASKREGGEVAKEKDEKDKDKDTQTQPLDGAALEALIEKRITESVDERLGVVESQAKLREALAASGLPENAVARLTETLGGRVLKAEEIAAGIKEETEYIDSFAKARVTGAGLVKGATSVTDDEAEKMGKALLGLFDPQMKPVDGVPPFRNLHEAFRAFTGQHFEDDDFGFNTPIGVPYKLTMAVDRRRKGRLVEAASIRRLREATEYTTATWADVFGDVMYKSLMKEFSLDYLQDWRKVVSDIESLKDFMTVHRVIRGGIEALDNVAEGAAYVAQTNPAGDEEIEYAISKKGNIFTFTWEMFLNDDIGAMRRQIRAMGRGAAQTLYQAIFDLFRVGFATTAPDYAGGKFWFDATHASGSNESTAALSYSAVTAAMAAMRAQLAYHDGTNEWEPLGNAVAPRWLVVPNELEELAFQICRNVKRPRSAENDLNLMRERGLDYVVVDYWTDANNWFLVCDPATFPTVVVGFLRGKQTPDIFVQDMETVGSMFDSDEITYKLRFPFGTDVLRHEGVYGQLVT